MPPSSRRGTRPPRWPRGTRAPSASSPRGSRPRHRSSCLSGTRTPDADGPVGGDRGLHRARRRRRGRRLPGLVVDHHGAGHGLGGRSLRDRLHVWAAGLRGRGAGHARRRRDRNGRLRRTRRPRRDGACRTQSRPPGIASYAISAVDIALWDLKARLLDLPLHRLLGAARETVPIYGSGGFTSYDEQQMRDQLESWVEDLGVDRVKIKIGQDRGTAEARDLARLAQARRIIGDHVDLFADANGGYGPKQAIRVAQRAAEHGLVWFEEPVSSDHLEMLAAIRGSVDADVAAGEYGCDIHYFRRMCAAGAVDCLQADATRCGGISGWLQAAVVADSFGLEISGHCAPAVHAHVAAAVPNLRHLEWFHDHVRIEQMLFDGAPHATGSATRPARDRPGLGLELRTQDAEPFRVA